MCTASEMTSCRHARLATTRGKSRKDRSHKTRGRGRRHVPRLGKDPSSDYEIDDIDVIELDEDEAVEAFEATEPAPEMDPFDVIARCAAEAPSPPPKRTVEWTPSRNCAR